MSNSHRNTTRSFNPLTVALLAVIVAITCYQAGAYRPEPVSQSLPMVFATFDLEKTFNTLDEKKAADAALQRIAEDLKKGTDAAARELQQLEKDLDDLQPGTSKHREMLETLTLKSHEYQAAVEFARAKIDIEKARTMKTLYQSIKASAATLAKERGYKVIFVDDSIAPIPPGTSEEMTRQISARRMVYTSPDVDVTDELIRRMNAAFKTAGPAHP